MKAPAHRTLHLALTLLACSLLAFAQTAPAPPAANAPAINTGPATRDANGVLTIRRTARLVILDVVVTDAKGNVVTGLTKKDFRVTESDQPQNILNFEAAGAHANDITAPINSTADLDRVAPRTPVNILLLDEFNTRFEDMAFARYSLKKLLERQPDTLATPTMLIAVNLQSLSVLVDYTQNKAALITALDHHLVAFPWQVHQGGWLAERYGVAFNTLMRVSQAVIGHQGHKNMIWIGRGFPPLNFSNVALDTANRVDNAVQECVNALRDARVTLYTVDPAGLTASPGGGYGSDAAFDDPFGGNYQFSKLAVATGGKTFYGRNDVDVEIGTGVRDGASFYTLTYRPDNNVADPQKFRRIRIALNQPNLKATTREGYYIQRGPARVDAKNPSRRLTSELLSAEGSNMAYDGVPITLVASPDNPDQFTVHVDAGGLVWSPVTDTVPKRYTDVIIMATSFDKKGKGLQRISREIHAAATEDVPPTGPLKRSLDLKLTLDHDPKAVRARFVVRVTANGRIGTADANLTQAAAAK